MNFLELQAKFPDQQDVIAYFIESRYGKSLKCPHCGEVHRISRMKNRPKFFQCNSCNNTFSIFKGTIFEKTRTDLRKWVYAINKIAVAGKKGVSSLQIMREIGVTKKCAWRMLKQIRFAMQNNSNFELFQAVVEIDETYLGGKPRHKGQSKRGRGSKKTPILGIYDRASGKVFAHKLETEDGKTLTGKQLVRAMDRKIAPNATYITDEFRSYRILDKLKRKHQVVNHSETYVAGDGTNTNTIECFWSLVKRMHYGTYHRMSAKYLDLYMSEEAFRFSFRKNMDEIFPIVMKQAVLAG